MFLIQEAILPQEKREIELIESTITGYKMPKAKIRTVLQTANEKNKNKRIYPKTLLERGLRDLKPLIETRTLVGELDHPCITGNEAADSYRHFVVLYEKVSHIIEQIYVEGNTVYGVVETASTDNGYKMAGLIMDKVPVGFSLRAMGETRSLGDGSVEITAPFSMITYDCVANPSHAAARMTEFVTEGINHTLAESYLIENEGMILYDRFDIINKNKYNEDTSNNKLSKLVENLEVSIKKNKINKSNKLVDALITMYLKESKDSFNSSIVDFLDEYINGNAPLDQVFKKYIKTI